MSSACHWTPPRSPWFSRAMVKSQIQAPGPDRTGPCLPVLPTTPAR
jgi:hypothetical protein